MFEKIIRYKPRLSTFQLLGENNFKLLLHLLPEGKEDSVIYQIGQQNFCLRYVEQTNYTSLVTLTWDTRLVDLNYVDKEDKNSQSIVFSDSENLFLSKGMKSNLLIRLYYDAKLAEVLAKNRKPYEGKYFYPNADLLQVDEKERLNLFLYEWLRACIFMGKKSSNTRHNNSAP
ncbi:DUF1249 domain-containing protein [Thorsellia kenyensis]|uniref:DUF1249 domain-containing protein n=1 Tax=Thorsellia kenyensis TaxID=1549888 RepID=A0ABV6CCJ1_9GAMM